MWNKIKDDRIRFCIYVFDENLDYTHIFPVFFSGMNMDVVNAINNRKNEIVYAYDHEWKIEFGVEHIGKSKFLKILKRNGKKIEVLEINFSKFCIEDIENDEILAKMITYKAYEKPFLKKLKLTKEYSIFFKCNNGDVGLHISSGNLENKGSYAKNMFGFVERYKSFFTKTKEEYLAEDAKFDLKRDLQK